MKALIVGAGGHAKVVTDIIEAQGDEVVGYLTDEQERWGLSHYGYPILGALNIFPHVTHDFLIIAIGSNQARKRIHELLTSLGAHWGNAIHPSAVISRSVNLGSGIVIAANTVINADASIGHHSIVNTNASIDHDSRIGNFTHIAPGAHLAGAVIVGEGTFMGVGTSVIPEIEIGSWALIGAGSVVVRPIPERVTAKGVPARW